jgi:hypothetical protein
MAEPLYPGLERLNRLLAWTAACLGGFWLITIASPDVALYFIVLTFFVTFSLSLYLYMATLPIVLLAIACHGLTLYLSRNRKIFGVVVLGSVALALAVAVGATILDMRAVSAYARYRQSLKPIPALVRTPVLVADFRPSEYAECDSFCRSGLFSGQFSSFVSVRRNDETGVSVIRETMIDDGSHCTNRVYGLLCLRQESRTVVPDGIWLYWDRAALESSSTLRFKGTILKVSRHENRESVLLAYADSISGQIKLFPPIYVSVGNLMSGRAPERDFVSRGEGFGEFFEREQVFQ